MGFSSYDTRGKMGLNPPVLILLLKYTMGGSPGDVGEAKEGLENEL